MTLERLSRELQVKYDQTRGFSEGNVGDLIRNKAKPKNPDTTNRIRAYLKQLLGESESVDQGSVSVEAGFEIRETGSEYLTREEWKRRAENAEHKLAAIVQILQINSDASAAGRAVVRKIVSAHANEPGPVPKPGAASAP
jgi:hypothetical protein